MGALDAAYDARRPRDGDPERDALIDGNDGQDVIPLSLERLRERRR